MLSASNFLFQIIVPILLVTNQAKSVCQRCFPSDFFWGTATSAYQIEGGWNISGKGENIWDWFSHTYPEKIEDGSNGDIAADSYNQYLKDVELLKNLGVNFYRLSLSWTRILPDGTINNINQDGVDYYLNLLQALKANNIEPLVTIYHWDLPLTLHELGGWTNPEIADYYADYANLCFRLFGHLVHYWVTLNEPITQCYFGYGRGTHAPGYQQSGTLTYICAYTQLLAHAKAYRIYNETYKPLQNGKVAIVLVANWYEPLNSTNPEDIKAAENGLQWPFGMFAHPIFIGNWPQVMIDRIGNLSIEQGLYSSRLPKFTDEELELIKGTFDYLGVNYYSAMYATPIENITDIEKSTINYLIDRNADTTIVDPNWIKSESSAIWDVPEGFRAFLNWIAKNYNNPQIFITENGWPDDNSIGLNDNGRINYINGHLCNLWKAINIDHINVFGYTYWSLLDNYEWSNGYLAPFGLVSVNFSSSELIRTPKQSYYFYQNIVTTNCLENCKIL